MLLASAAIFSCYSWRDVGIRSEMQQTRRDVRKPVNNFKPLPAFRPNISDPTDSEAMRSNSVLKLIRPQPQTKIQEECTYKRNCAAIWTECSERGVKSLINLVQV